ncbi:hypothetical protein U0070_002839 [Myodes glareolus]|uniref:C2 domain-containing protein n=1 Tax=Myodes glareolus TaxID=447135 RepID=A0AAW0I7L1_MYOGA
MTFLLASLLRSGQKMAFREAASGATSLLLDSKWKWDSWDVSLLCDGRRLKKKKTTIKKNTLNPVYNEAIIFDIPPENMDQVSLLISVMDYDRVGHNEIIGVCRVGINAEGLGRDHWNEMLAYPRKPIAHWHSLVEVKKSFKEWQGRAASFDSESSCPSPKPPPTP